jgi:hypothetical protein
MCTADLHNPKESAVNRERLTFFCDIRGSELSPAALRCSAFVIRMGVYVSLRALMYTAQDLEDCISYDQAP